MLKHFDKNNLHHAYLIEGAKDQVLPSVFELLDILGVSTLANPDFIHIDIDSIKIDDARRLKAMGSDKGYGSEIGSKKIFIISTNSFLLEAQNTLLKMFEEPIENTHFFLIMPDADSLLPTFKSRFYFISSNQDSNTELKNAEKFIAMSLAQRIEFVKELIAETEDEDEAMSVDSTRAKAQKFLNALETTLHSRFTNAVSKGKLDNTNNLTFFDQIFKVRKFLRQPGSSTKSLMESVALSVPEKI